MILTPLLCKTITFFNKLTNSIICDFVFFFGVMEWLIRKSPDDSIPPPIANYLYKKFNVAEREKRCFKWADY